MEFTDIHSEPYPIASVSAIPTLCRITVDRRLLLPGETEASLLTPIRGIIATLGEGMPISRPTFLWQRLKRCPLLMACWDLHDETE